MLDNDGTLEVAAGVVGVRGEGIDNAGVLSLAPGSRVTTSSYRQTASGVLRLAFTDPGPAGGNSQLVVERGPLELDGALDLHVDPEMVAFEGGTVLIVAAPFERIGSFAVVTGLETAPGVEVRYDEPGVLLTQEP